MQLIQLITKLSEREREREKERAINVTSVIGSNVYSETLSSFSSGTAPLLLARL